MIRALITYALVLATAGLILSNPAASAGKTVYRWTDANGHPVNSDVPPPQGTKYDVISTSSSMVHKVEDDAAASPATTDNMAANPNNATTASKDATPVETQRPVVEKDPEKCKAATDNLQTLDTHARIRIRNEQGEYRYIDEAEKEEQRKLARDAISAFCEESN